MIWETRCSTIAMLQDADPGQKCHRYWPDSTLAPPQPRLRYGDITVAHDDSQPRNCFVVRTFTMK